MTKKNDGFDLDTYIGELADSLAEKHRNAPKPSTTLIEMKVKQASADQAGRDHRDRKTKPPLTYRQ